MDANTLRRRPGEGPVLHQDRVRQATRRVGDDFETRVVLFLLYAKERTLEQVGEALDLPAVDVEELRREALRMIGEKS